VVRSPLSGNVVKPRSSSYARTFNLLVLLIVGYLALVIQATPAPFNASLYCVPFVIIGALALYGLRRSCQTQPYSLLTTHWTFILFFFCIAPWVQFWVGQFPPQADLGYFYQYHFHAAGVTIVWEVVMLLTYSSPPATAQRRENTWKTLVPREWVLVPLSLMCFAILVVVLGPGALIARSDQFSNYDTISPALIMVATICRAIPFTCAVLGSINWRSKTIFGKMLAVFLILVAVGSNFPTAVARFWIGGMLVGIVCLYMTERRKTALWLPMMFLVSFLLVMPILGSFRRADTGNMLSVEVETPDFATVPLRGDFDNYIMLVDSAGYLDKNEPTYGVTLYGNLLFFVPKTFWPDKPRNTRDLFIQGTQLEKINGNVANSIIAESIMNFGWLGVLAYAFFFGRMFKKIDTLYWSPPPRVSRFQTSMIVSYPFLVGFLVYFMRGSFVPALSSTVSFWVSVWLTVILGTKNPEYKLRLPIRRKSNLPVIRELA